MLMIVNLFSPDGSRDNSVPEQLRHDPDQGRAGAACTASATSPTSASATTACGSGSTRRRWPRRNLTATDVVAAIEEQNIQVAAGQIGQPPVANGQPFQFTINTLGRLIDPEQFARHDPQDQTPQRPTHRAAARRGPHRAGRAEYDQSCTLDGRPSVALSIYQLPGSNALETARGVYAQDGGARSSGSPRGSTTRSSTTRRRSSASRSTRSSRRCATR